MRDNPSHGSEKPFNILNWDKIKCIFFFILKNKS